MSQTLTRATYTEATLLGTTEVNRVHAGRLLILDHHKRLRFQWVGAVLIPLTIDLPLIANSVTDWLHSEQIGSYHLTTPVIEDPSDRARWVILGHDLLTHPGGGWYPTINEATNMIRKLRRKYL